MTTYKFIYEGRVFEDSSTSSFPSSTTLEAFHEFDADQSWQTILWQFCRFLEHVGFEGVRERVKISGHCDTNLFQDFYERPVGFQEMLEEYCEALDKHDGDAV